MMTTSDVMLDVTKSVLVRSEPGRRSGVTAETIPGSKILMQVLTVAPGDTAVPGNDIDTETAAYIVSGRAKILSGKDFTDGTDVGPEDFYFTPVQLPHLISNPYDNPLKLVLAYSLDPTRTNTVAGSKAVEASPMVRVVPTPTDIGTTAQTRGMRRVAAISTETVGASQIWMCSLSVSPNERGQAHHHGDTHTVAYTISGRARICFGQNFEEFVDLEAGDFAFDPPGLVHLVDQVEDAPWKGVLARCPQNTVVNFAE
jgi:uncharacterized RmlC-like cupin family protein